jgi:hypothetical protein
MTSRTIAEGAAAGDAGSPGANSGSAALYGKNVAGGRIGRAVTIRSSSAILNAGKIESTSSSTGSAQGSQLGAVTAAARSAAEQHAIWKEEFAGQTSRLMEANDPHGLPDPLDLPSSFNLADSSVPASFSQANPGFQPAKQSVFSASFPASGQLSSLVKTKASEQGLAGLSHGRTGVSRDELSSNPVPPIQASNQGSAQRIPREGSEPASKSRASTRDFHASGPSRDQALHSGDGSSNRPTHLPMPASAIASLPVALSAFTTSTVQAPAMAGNRRQDDSQVAVSRPVSETGNPVANSVLAIDSVLSSGRSAATPAAEFSLAAGISTGSSLPIGLEARNLPSGEALAGAGSMAGNRDSGTESSGFAAKLSVVREAASSALSSLDPGTHMPDGMPSEVVFSAAGLSLSPSQGSLTPSQLAANVPALSAVIQSSGVVNVTGPVSQRGASVHGVAGAGRDMASREPAAATVSADVELGAASLAKRPLLGTDYRLAANQGTMPSAERSPAGLSGQRGAGKTWTKSPVVEGALLHGPESDPAGISFPHLSLSEADSVAPRAVVREVGLALGNSEAGQNPFEAMDQMGRMDRATATGSAGTAGPSGRGIAATYAGDTAHALQVGYQDPVLGYVELRAHTGVNGVHASLETQSSAAGDTLTAHLSALTGWMNERRTPVESLTVSTLAWQQDSSRHEKDFSSRGDSAGSQAGNGGYRDGNFAQGNPGDGSLANRSEEHSSGSSISSPRSSSGAESGSEPDLGAALTVAAQGSAVSFLLPASSGGSFSIVV